MSEPSIEVKSVYVEPINGAEITRAVLDAVVLACSENTLVVMRFGDHNYTIDPMDIANHILKKQVEIAFVTPPTP